MVLNNKPHLRTKFRVFARKTFQLRNLSGSESVSINLGSFERNPIDTVSIAIPIAAPTPIFQNVIPTTGIRGVYGKNGGWFQENIQR
jgi:hypothetical protein